MSLVFFTDGQDTCNTPEIVNKKLEELADFIKKTTIFSETHTIGFTADHDALLLSRITTIGKDHGTFQYCKTSKDIPMCVDSVAGLIGGQSFSAKIKIPGRSEVIDLELEEGTRDGEGKEFDTLFYVKEEGITKGSTFELVVNVDTQNVSQSINYDDIPIDEEGKVGVLTLQLGLIKSEVHKLVKEATNLKLDKKVDGSAIESLIKRLEREELALETYLKDLGKGLKTSQRKDIYPLAQEVRDQIIEFYAALRSLQKGQISNDAIASLNALAYKGITKKGLQKKLDKRTQQNVNLINDVYEKVSKV
ncbi:MAG: hypothetical protein EOP48_30700, partial [Sphingobacteriales bacterium]